MYKKNLLKTYLLFTKNIELAQEEINAKGGQITQIFTKHVFVANLPDTLVETLENSSVEPKGRLSRLSNIFVKAWKFSELKKSKEIKPEKYKTWGENGNLAPKNRINDKKLAEQHKLYPTSTSSYMIGSISVGLVIVSGPTKSLKFTESQISKIFSEVISSLQSLASFEPMANITFKYVVNVLTIDAQASECNDFETCERIWRDPALELLNCSPELDGVEQYNRRLMEFLKTDWAYTAFFTKYPIKHFAYAGSGRLCILYDNKYFSSDNLDSLFAHETCHIFGANDEYRRSQCNCYGTNYFNVPNYNCENCGSIFPKRVCVMFNNDLSNLCPWTRGQLGWPYAAISKDLANNNWNNYYGTAVAFVSNGKNYLFAHSDSGDRWFISELTPDGKGFETELASGNWNNYYSTAVVFVSEGKNYLFAHSDSGNRWFISELTPDGKGFETELANGKWNNHYGTAMVFVSEGKNYLFAHSDSGNRWFISELTPDGKGFETELSNGKWNNYYGSSVAFVSEGKNYLFAHSDSGNRWFTSELTPDGKGLETELANGSWNNYYGTVVVFVAEETNYLYAQSNWGNRFFISELLPNGKSLYSELDNDHSYNFCGTVVNFVSKNVNYLFQHTSSGKKWTINKLVASRGGIKP